MQPKASLSLEKLELTIAGADALAPSREVKRLAHRHLAHMEVVLADVNGRLLRHKLIKRVTVVRNLPLHFQVRVQLSSQR